MTKETKFHYHPYRKHIFWVVFFLCLGILLVSNVTLYILRSSMILSDLKDTLRVSATNVASMVPIRAHESLIDSTQQSSTDYKNIESEFKLIIAGNPNIDDIYTLRPTANPNEMSFVVSAQTTEDANGDNNISEDEIKPTIGEVYDISPFPRLQEAINYPTADDAVTYDKWGAWLSGYAPIMDDSGKTLAILGIDYSADYISALKQDIWRSNFYIDMILFPFILLMAWYISRRVSRPFAILAYGLERLSHGDFEYHHSSSRHKDEKIFDDLFNRIVSLFDTLKHRRPPE